MVVKKVNKHLVDVFVDLHTFPTGFEPSCWLRLAKRGNNWVQVDGIRLLSWQFKKLIGELK